MRLINDEQPVGGCRPWRARPAFCAAIAGQLISPTFARTIPSAGRPALTSGQGGLPEGLVVKVARVERKDAIHSGRGGHGRERTNRNGCTCWLIAVAVRGLPRRRGDVDRRVTANRSSAEPAHRPWPPDFVPSVMAWAMLRGSFKGRCGFLGGMPLDSVEYTPSASTAHCSA